MKSQLFLQKGYVGKTYGEKEECNHFDDRSATMGFEKKQEISIGYNAVFGCMV